MRQYFFDTYALIEIIKGNPNYAKYTKAGIATTVLQLYELYYSLLKNFNKETAERFFAAYKPQAIEFSDTSLKKAAEFKLKHKKKRLSYVDCQGYILAQELSIPFLTGDKEFKGMKGVEFVQ